MIDITLSRFGIIIPFPAKIDTTQFYLSIVIIKKVFDCFFNIDLVRIAFLIRFHHKN